MIATAARIAAGVPAGWDWDAWGERHGGALVVASVGFDPAWERAALDDAGDRPLLSFRFGADELQIGPLWTAGAETGCAGCAHAAATYQQWESVKRPERDRAARERQTAQAVAASYAPHGFPPWLEPAVNAALGTPLAPGAMVVIGASGGITRHRIGRTFRCRICGEPRALFGTPDVPPPGRVPERRPTAERVPTRAGDPFGMDAERMRARLGDARFGPVVRMTRNSEGAFPMSEVEMLAGTPAGVGRARTFAAAEAVGVLEAYERLGGYPHAAPIVVGRSRNEIGDRTIDPATLGGYTARQLAAPTCKVAAYHDDAALDWVWAHPLDGGPARLVPAEVGFYRYGYGLRGGGRGYFLDSSSGSALGSSYEEAALHSLLELAERDAFLQAWHRRRPLPRLDPAGLHDRESAMMAHLADESGYDVHLLAASSDIPVPVVWALAIRRDGQLPATFSAAGCHPDPVRAARAALWELSQLVGAGLAWDPEPLRASITDPWLIEDIAGHWRRYTFPELRPRVVEVLGGPVVDPADAFPGWPDRLVEAADGDVTGSLEYVAGLFADAGLDRILVVDQSTPDHTAIGLTVVKCVVPGILPMCFGQSHQRFLGLDRLLGHPVDPDEAPYDPHPFP